MHLAQATATACPDPQPLKVSLRPPTALAATVDPLPSSPGTTMLLMLLMLVMIMTVMMLMMLVMMTVMMVMMMRW